MGSKMNKKKKDWLDPLNDKMCCWLEQLRFIDVFGFLISFVVGCIIVKWLLK